MRDVARPRIVKAVVAALVGILLMLSVVYAVHFCRTYGTFNFFGPPQRLVYRERGFVLVESRGPVDSRSLVLETLQDNPWPLPDLLDGTTPGSTSGDFFVYVRTWDGRLWTLEEVGVG